MFIEKEINCIKTYNGSSLPQEEQKLLLQFIEDNDGGVAVNGFCDDVKYVWVQSALDYLKDEECENGYTQKEVIKLIDLFEQANKIHIDKIVF